MLYRFSAEVLSASDDLEKKTILTKDIVELEDKLLNTANDYFISVKAEKKDKRTIEMTRIAYDVRTQKVNDEALFADRIIRIDKRVGNKIVAKFGHALKPVVLLECREVFVKSGVSIAEIFNDNYTLINKEDREKTRIVASLSDIDDSGDINYFNNLFLQIEKKDEPGKRGWYEGSNNCNAKIVIENQLDDINQLLEDIMIDISCANSIPYCSTIKNIVDENGYNDLFCKKVEYIKKKYGRESFYGKIHEGCGYISFASIARKSSDDQFSIIKKTLNIWDDFLYSECNGYIGGHAKASHHLRTWKKVGEQLPIEKINKELLSLEPGCWILLFARKKAIGVWKKRIAGELRFNPETSTVIGKFRIVKLEDLNETHNLLIREGYLEPLKFFIK